MGSRETRVSSFCVQIFFSPGAKKESPRDGFTRLFPAKSLSQIVTPDVATFPNYTSHKVRLFRGRIFMFSPIIMFEFAFLCTAVFLLTANICKIVLF